jgi:hypothetical protein
MKSEKILACLVVGVICVLPVLEAQGNGSAWDEFMEKDNWKVAV